MSIARFGFFVFTLTYILLLGLEFLRPGFVSFVFSPHLWLFPMVAFGFFYAQERKTPPTYRALFVTIPLGVMLGVLFWSVGGVFGDFRLLLALGVVALPSLAYFSTRDTN